MGLLRRRGGEDVVEVQAQASVYDPAGEFDSMRPGGWDQGQWDSLMYVLNGDCGKRPAIDIITDSACGDGVVATVSTQFAMTAADAPTTVDTLVNGQWVTVNPEDSADAAEAHAQLRSIRPESGDFEDLVFNGVFSLASVGKASAFTHRDDFEEMFHQIQMPQAVKARWNGRAEGRPDFYSWQRHADGRAPKRVDTVRTMLWPHPKYDRDPLLVWAPAARHIEGFDRIQILLDQIVQQNLLGGIMFFEGYEGARDANGQVTEPQTVTDLKSRITEVRSGKVDKILKPIMSGGSKAPTMIWPAPELQDVLIKAAEHKIVQIGRFGPVEMGSITSGEASGSHWQATVRDRQTVSRIIGPLRRRFDRDVTRWALRPKLAMLRAEGLFGSSPDFWRVSHDIDAVVNRPDNATEVFNLIRLGGASLSAGRRVVGLKPSDAPSREELETIKCMTGKSASEINDFFGDYDEDRSQLPDRRVGIEAFGDDPGPDTTSTVPAPVQRAVAAVDPFADLAPVVAA